MKIFKLDKAFTVAGPAPLYVDTGFLISAIFIVLIKMEYSVQVESI